MTEEKKAKKVVKLLKEHGLTLSLAESCTGGALAASIVDVPGASEVFLLGLVTYSNKAKKKLLGVKKSTLKEHGAVSAKCAKEMAKGGCAALDTDICLSVTGLAGPGGGTEEIPVGTVFMGCSFRGKTKTREFHFAGNRSKIREASVENGLDFLLEVILGFYEKKNHR